MNKQKLISGLLFSGSLVFSAASSIMAAYRQPKYEQVLAGTKEGKFQKPIAIAKTHWPSMVLWGASAGCAIAGKVIDVKTIVGLTGTAAYLASTRDKWEQKFKEYAGIEEYKKAKQEITKEVIKERVVCTAGPSVEETGRGDQLCYEGYSGRWFRSDKAAVDLAIKEFKDKFECGEYLCLNDLYALFGLAETHFGFEFGYPANDDYYDSVPDIEATMIEAGDVDMKKVFGKVVNEPVYVIDIYTYPMQCWMEV